MGNSDQLALELATSLSSLTTASTSLNESSTALSSAASSFSSIVQKIETRFKDLAAWEASLDERKKILDELNNLLDVREEKLKKDEQEVKQQKEELKLMKDEWDNKEMRMRANIDAVVDTVTLNIRGHQFTVSKQLLTKFKDSYFSTLFQCDANDKRDNFFIQRNPKHFETVLNYLQDGRISKKIKPKHRDPLREEFSFYNIPVPVFEIAEEGHGSDSETTGFDSPGDLLSVAWQRVIQSWIPSHRFHLLYKATKDGFTPTVFHDLCDSRGPTLLVVSSSDGYLFGGYTLTTIAEDSAGNTERHVVHSSSFMYTLTNPHALPPTQYPLLQGSWPTLYTPTEHIHLGWGRWGYDLAISKNAKDDKKSYFGFPFAFKDKTGLGKLTFTNSEYFTVRDIEVYSVVPIHATSSQPE